MPQPVVLIVDDEPKIFQALRRALHRESYELLYADGGEAALKLLAERTVDVIIADENMPGMQGSVLLARARTQWPDMIRMMLTGDARLETVVAAVNKGEIYRFFTKPCNEAELIVSIRDGLQLRALKLEASRLLATVRRQNETIKSMSAQDGSVPSPGSPSGASSSGSGGSRSGSATPGSSSSAGSPASPASPDGELPTITLKQTSKPAPGAPGGRRTAPRGVYQIEPADIPDDVDKLLDEIRAELEKLDL